MAQNTTIEWADHTVNFWHGCTKVSPACERCYAAAIDARHLHSPYSHWGPGVPRLDKRETAARVMGNLQRQVERKPVDGYRPRVFVNSMSDWLDPEVPVEWLADLLLVCHLHPGFDFLLLTKRPELWSERVGMLAEIWDHPAGRMARGWLLGAVPENLWIGATVEDQTRAYERVPMLLKIPAAVRFLSCEPLLAPVDLTIWIWDEVMNPSPHPVTGPMYIYEPTNRLHWVIAGGETGAGARRLNADSLRSLQHQCAAAGLKFFFKQWGARGPRESPPRLDGVAYLEIPDTKCPAI